MAIDLALARLLKKLSLKMAMEATVIIEIWGVWRDSILPHKRVSEKERSMELTLDQLMDLEACWDVY